MQALAGISSSLGINPVVKGISLWVDSTQALASVGELYGEITVEKQACTDSTVAVLCVH